MRMIEKWSALTDNISVQGADVALQFKYYPKGPHTFTVSQLTISALELSDTAKAAVFGALFFAFNPDIADANEYIEIQPE